MSDREPCLPPFPLIPSFPHSLIPSFPPSLILRLKHELHQNRILATALGGVVAAAHGQLVEPGLVVQQTRGDVGGPDLEQHALRFAVPRDADEVLEQRSTQATPLPALRDAQIEQVGFVDAEHQHAVPDHLAGALHYPAAVARVQRIAEVADAPGMAVYGALDRDDVRKLLMSWEVDLSQ